MVGTAVAFLVAVFAVPAASLQQTWTTSGPADFTLAATVPLPGLDTGIDVERGREITITATGLAGYGAEGAGPCGAGGYLLTTPDGQRYFNGQPCSPKIDGNAVLGNAPIGELIARIDDGPWLAIGFGLTFAAESSGRIRLLYNDAVGTWSDNSGTYNVAISLGPTSGVTGLDTWSRSVVSGWGSADVGGAYANKPGEVSSFSVAGGLGAMRVPLAGASRQTWLPAVSARDVDAVVSVGVDKASSGPYGYLASIALRRQSANTEYRARLRFGPAGRVFVAATRSTGTTTETFVGSEVVVPAVTATPGVPMRMRAQVTGSAPTTIRIRVWPASATEPSTWQVVRTNSEPVLQTPGSVGLMGYVSGSATNVPVVFSFDNLDIRGT